ncbi:uncharacterized protein LOC106635843 [Copidosoma floridanum]|uniref:uncharacterized protein LOC106635843 n=1 Tax=Copidosoma floridanum TaxID=29053 RepID=UPI0006C953DB|nr:uncharacterized protein LOC106635843 [Copidosoma floridanum]
MRNNVVILLLFTNMPWFLNVIQEYHAAAIVDGDSDCVDPSVNHSHRAIYEKFNQESMKNIYVHFPNDDTHDEKKFDAKSVNNSIPSGRFPSSLTPNDLQFVSFIRHTSKFLTKPSVYAARKCQANEIWIHDGCRPKD